MGRNIKLGQGQFTLYDNLGNPVLISGDLGNNETGMRLQDDNGLEVAEFGKQADGTVSIKFFDASGTAVGQFGRQTDGTSNLKFFDNTNHEVARFGRQADSYTALKFFDNTGIGLARFGQFSDGSTALKVAKSGIEVDTATNDQLIFNSGQDVFKIVSIVNMSNTVTESPSAGSTHTVTQAHGLSFTPSYMAFNTLPASIFSDLGLSGGVNEPNPATLVLPTGTGLTIAAYAQVSVDATNISFVVGVGSLGSSSYTFTTKVYLLQETAT